MPWKVDVKVTMDDGLCTGLRIKRGDDDEYGFLVPKDSKGNSDWANKVIKQKKVK